MFNFSCELASLFLPKITSTLYLNKAKEQKNVLLLKITLFYFQKADMGQKISKKKWEKKTAIKNDKKYRHKNGGLECSTEARSIIINNKIN
ncbi:hypothetical protein BpHYR1_043992 [Brachionus plicatilis]|uniref:Uncharacterized protein n=1 Tax=Brachionus plicatilis TaxID=10195 RepID=A0A3M7QTJ0_BRAPC|nr:hypothetical protein BpHYR1_043992 [Brachionus plicatilis]